MKIETKLQKPYRRVPRPIEKFTPSKVVSKPPAPPAVSHKPGSKVYLYVYDSEPETPASAPQYYRNPHFTRQTSEGSVQYPYANEKKQRQETDAQHPSPPIAQNRTGRQRVRDQGKKSDKGYKVLAEVTPHLRSSSRGGRMFVKQRQRMEQYTKESQNTRNDENNPYAAEHNDFVDQGASDGWATPWNMANKSPTAVKYITAKRLAGPMNKTSRRALRDPLGFLPKPPDFWRAKVEQNFPNGPKVAPPIRPRSRQWHNPGYGEMNGYSLHRPDSAPPDDSPSLHDDQYYNPNNIYDEYDNGYLSEYDVPRRPASVSLPGATIHFNAKQYYAAPHRRQGLRKGWNTYTTTPHVERDFNARPKGWNRYY
uniref:uncharacterized protein LOC120347633 n=1 Tax=Styela clava TaxID=7725 RepID=UPI0019397054|nr:uncharacterized protein LOC120347633 [Styela clava]